MACRTLLRRKTQLDLLANACERGIRARIGSRRRAAAIGEVRFVALERDGLRMAWTGTRLPEVEGAGQPVEVRFEHAGEAYVFVAVARGRVGPGPAEVDEAQPLLKLSLPLRLERARRRQQLRLDLEGRPPIMSTFTHVVDGRREFRARLSDIGDGGLGVTVSASEVSQLHTGDLFWVDVKLPGEETHTELVVRLKHLRPIRDSDKLAMGWAFQPTDDIANYERYLRRLEAFIART